MIKYIRLRSGEHIIAETESETDTTVFLKNPIEAMPQGNQLSFVPFAPLASKAIDTIAIPKDYVVFMTDPAEELVENYKRQFSAVFTPSTKIIT